MKHFGLFLLLATPAFCQNVNVAKCSALQTNGIPDVIITEAKPVQDAKFPPFCMVHGVIDQRKGVGGVTYGIGFELRLPANYEGRFLFQGGGGMDGVIRPAVGNASGANANPGLARGIRGSRRRTLRSAAISRHGSITRTGPSIG